MNKVELFSLFVFISSGLLYDLTTVTNNNDFIKYISLVLFVTAFVLYIFVSSDRNPVLVFSFFILSKCIVLSLSLIDIDYLQWVMFNGDAQRLHIPTVLNMNMNNIIPYLTDFDTFAIVTGRLSHVLFYSYWSVISAFVYFDDLYAGVMISAYIANSSVLLIAGWIIYSSLISVGIDRELACKGVVLFLFSPFLLAWGAMPMKEPVISLLVILVAIQIVHANRIVLIFASFLFLFERLYMVYLSAAVLIITKKISLITKIISCVLIVGMFFVFFPMDKFVTILLYQIEFQENVAESGRSLASGGVLNNILRVLFSPFPFATFFIASDEDFYYRVHYLIQPIYVFLMFRIIFTKSKFSLLILFILLVNFVLFPYGARQKINVLIPLLSIMYPIFIYCRRNNIPLHSFWRM